MPQMLRIHNFGKPINMVFFSSNTPDSLKYYVHWQPLWVAYMGYTQKDTYGAHMDRSRKTFMGPTWVAIWGTYEYPIFVPYILLAG